MSDLVRSVADRLEMALDSPDLAAVLDAEDVLAKFRAEFSFPQHDNEPATYFCGNSLGLLSRRSKQYVMEELDKWATRGVEGHFEGDRPWARIDEFVTGLSAELVGALPAEVAVMNSLSLNLHLMMVSFFRPSATRFKIIVEDDMFCSDSHIVMSQLRLHGLDPATSLIRIRPRPGQHCLSTDDIIAKIVEHGAQVALVLFSGVQFFTGQFFDMKKITDAGHQVGAYVGFDLAHAVGNVSLRLHEWGVDFACWCSYKYLNSGPGGIAGAFLHEKHHQDRTLPRMEGWWGQALKDRFSMRPDHHPIPGAQAYQLSNPCVLAVVSLLGSLEVFHEATMTAIDQKRTMLTGYLELLLQSHFSSTDVIQLTPSTPADRGSQLSIRFSKPVRSVHAALTTMGVICDVREPNVIRICPAPLYNSFADVLKFVTLLTRAFKDDTSPVSKQS